MALITNLYSALAQGTLWGIMALGVYITFRILISQTYPAMEHLHSVDVSVQSLLQGESIHL